MYEINSEEPFSGSVYSETLKGNLKNGKRDGLWEFWYVITGEKESEGTYKNGKKDGLWTWWYENGQKKVEGIFKDGKPIKLIGNWNENGSVKE